MLHCWVLRSTLVLEREDRYDANRSPTYKCVDKTVKETPRQASGVIVPEPGQISLRARVVFASASALRGGHVFGDRNEFACVGE